jgi:hypothetical protein
MQSRVKIYVLHSQDVKMQLLSRIQQGHSGVIRRRVYFHTGKRRLAVPLRQFENVIYNGNHD